MSTSRPWHLVLSTMALALLLAGCGKKTTESTQAQGGGDALQGSHGAYQNVRQAAKRVADTGELSNFGKAYLQHALANGGRGPSGLQEVKDSINPKTIDNFKDDAVYVVNWNLPNVTGSSVIAYVKEPDSYGTHMVAKGDGSVGRMSKGELEAAVKR